MNIDFNNLLTNEQKKDLILQRIVQLSSEAYVNKLNKEVAEDLNDAEAAARAENNLASIGRAIEIHLNEMDALQ